MESPLSSGGTNKVVASFFVRSDAGLEHRLSDTSLRDSPVIAMLSERRTSIPKKETNYRILTTSSLLAVAWMLCCSTPDRNEPFIKLGGPLPAFCGLILFTICYSIPFSFVVAELCIAFPNDGGVAIWVKNAFGRFWGFQTGLWVWASLICSCSTSPDVFSKRIADVVGNYQSPVVERLVKMMIALFMAIPSFFGTRVVGRLSLYLMVVVLVPFVVFSVIGYACGHAWGDLLAIRYANSTTHDDGTMSFSGPTDMHRIEIFKTLFYCFDGTVMVSVFGGEVANPSATYRTAIFLKLAFHFGSFLLPLSSAVVYARPKWYDFDLGTFKQMANSISPDLANLLQISSDISTLGAFVASMFSQMYLLCGMAHNAMVPRQMARRNERFGTPYLAASCGVVITMVCIFGDYHLLNNISSACSALSQLVMMAAIIRLRLEVPQAFRHTALPTNLMALGALLVIPVLILCYMLYTAFTSPEAAWITILIVVFGFVVGGIMEWHNRKPSPGFADRGVPNELQVPVSTQAGDGMAKDGDTNQVS